MYLLRSMIVAGALIGGISCQFGSDVMRVNGTVHYYTLEGGFWAVRGDDSVTYDPLGGLPAEFRQEGLRIYLEGKIRNDMASIHMVGPIVEVRSIRKL